jgi:hypothetical protein
MAMTGSRARYVGAAVLMLALAVRADAATVTIAWDANPEAGISYDVCARLASSSCGSGVAIGNRTNWTFTGLQDNIQYFFAVRARNANGASAWAELGFRTPLPIPPGSEASRSDFNGDSWFDLLWQHNSNGQLVVWHLNATYVAWARFLEPPAVSPAWRLSGSGDFNKDGKPDLVWHNDQTGQVVYWLMDGIFNYSSGFFPGPVHPSWRIASIRDLNGDGNPDVWWHNQSTGDMAVWYFNGTTQIGSVLPNPSKVADVNWKLKGMADFNGDGKADALWHNEATGELRVWMLNGINAVSAANLNPAFVAPGWRISAVGDATMDNWPDIIWRNEQTGALVLWKMVGLNLISGEFLSIPTADLNWKIVAPK